MCSYEIVLCELETLASPQLHRALKHPKLFAFPICLWGTCTGAARVGRTNGPRGRSAMEMAVRTRSTAIPHVRCCCLPRPDGSPEAPLARGARDPAAVCTQPREEPSCLREPAGRACRRSSAAVLGSRRGSRQPGFNAKTGRREAHPRRRAGRTRTRRRRSAGGRVRAGRRAPTLSVREHPDSAWRDRERRYGASARTRREHEQGRVPRRLRSLCGVGASWWKRYRSWSRAPFSF